MIVFFISTGYFDIYVLIYLFDLSLLVYFIFVCFSFLFDLFCIYSVIYNFYYLFSF